LCFEKNRERGDFERPALPTARNPEPEEKVHEHHRVQRCHRPGKRARADDDGLGGS
jgi:hypothetical protein